MTFDVTFQEVSKDFSVSFGTVASQPCGVLYTEQSLTEEQQAQARKNIGACEMDDTTVGGGVWSSKNIVDRLCPAFTESGAVVTCEPVVDYPLDVTAETAAKITRCGKNLMTTDTVDTASTPYNKTLWSGSLKPPYVISADLSQYTMGNKAGLLQGTFEGKLNDKSDKRICYRFLDDKRGARQRLRAVCRKRRRD